MTGTKPPKFISMFESANVGVEKAVEELGPFLADLPDPMFYEFVFRQAYLMGYNDSIIDTHAGTNSAFEGNDE